MSKPYNVLNAMPPAAFLDPANFVTSFDAINPAKADEQYQTGLEYGRKATAVVICANGTWGADLKSGGYVSAYEGIGYHAHTASLLRGFLDSGAKIVVNRQTDNGVTSTVIKDATAEKGGGEVNVETSQDETGR